MKLKMFLPFITAVVLTFTEARAAAPAVITHIASEKKSAAAIRSTEEIRIMLPAPADSGPDYEWQIISNDSRVLRLTSSPKRAKPATKSAPADKTAAPAADNLWATSFVALRPGRSIVRIAYVPSVSKTEATPIDTREIIVSVR